MTTSFDDVCGMRRAVLAALLTAFLVIVQASNEYQCMHVAPGIDCMVQPGWALWCAYGACFAWLALALVAMIGGPRCASIDLECPSGSAAQSAGSSYLNKGLIECT